MYVFLCFLFVCIYSIFIVRPEPERRNHFSRVPRGPACAKCLCWTSFPAALRSRSNSGQHTDFAVSRLSRFPQHLISFVFYSQPIPGLVLSRVFFFFILLAPEVYAILSSRFSCAAYNKQVLMAPYISGVGRGPLPISDTRSEGI